MTVIAVVVMVYAPQLAGYMAKTLGLTGTIASGAFAGATVPTAMAASGIVATGASAVTRGIASAVGLASFSWRDVAVDGITSALSAGISEGLKGAGNAAAAGKTYKTVDAVKNIRELNALGRVIQGVGNYAGGVVANTVVGREANFSWSAVAATAVGSYVSAKLGGEVPGLKGGDVTAVGLEGLGQNFVDGAVNASARRLFGLGRQDWGQIGLQALSSTLANEAATGIMDWQAEQANRERQAAGSFGLGFGKVAASRMMPAPEMAPADQAWQRAAGGMGSGVEFQRVAITDVPASAREVGRSVPGSAGGDIYGPAAGLVGQERGEWVENEHGLLETLVGVVEVEAPKAAQPDFSAFRALMLRPEHRDEIDRISKIRIPQPIDFSCPIPGKVGPSEHAVGPMPTRNVPPSLEVQAIIRKHEQEQNRAYFVDRLGNILAFVPVFDRADNPINPNQLLNPINGEPVSYDEWTNAIADVGGSISLRGLAPSRMEPGAIVNRYGGEVQRQALLDQVAAAQSLSEAKGIVFATREMRRLGYDLENVLLHYRGNQGVDLVFSRQGRFAIVEAKHGRHLSSLQTYSGGLRQGSLDYNINRLERYLEYGDGKHNSLVDSLLEDSYTGQLESFVSLYRAQSTYELPVGWPAPSVQPIKR